MPEQRASTHGVPGVAAPGGSVREWPAPGAAVPTDSLGSAVIVAVALAIAQRLIGLGRSFLTCSWLDAEELGRWDMAFSFLVFVAPLAVFSLPGVLGRYVEHYRPRGQLKAFLARILGTAGLLAILSSVVLVAAGEDISRLLFGSAESPATIAWLAAALLGTLALNALVELLTALRLQRFSSGVVFAQSLAFAGLTALLLGLWPNRAEGVMAAYVLATAASGAVAAVLVMRAWRGLPAVRAAGSPRAIWPRVLPFAAWLWFTNAIENAFGLVGRYVMLHAGTLDASSALEQIGHYHSAQIIVVVLLNIATIVGALLTPYLARDWEHGASERAAVRIGLATKLTGLGLVVAAAGTLAIAPAVFASAFQGRLDGGLAVLPWALTGTVWAGMSCVARTQLWCAEAVRLWCVGVILGLVASVALTLLLLPRFGLTGVACSTALAQFVTFATVFWGMRMTGFRIDEGTWIVAALPPALLLGPWAGAVAAMAIATLIVTTDRVLQQSEKRALVSFVGSQWQRWTSSFPG